MTTESIVAPHELAITAAGHAQLTVELEALRTTARSELSERLREAREDGDLSDNPALADALEEQAQLERRIADLEAQLAAARVVPPTTDGEAGVGSAVRVRDLSTGELHEFELVGAIEADAANGRVSVAAPVGRALTGRRAGDRVEVEAPRGTTALEILAVGTEPPKHQRKEEG